jgi:ABC-type polysaccharide/polyol phosphate transport system ATPase subunit
MGEPAVIFDRVWKKFRRGERHDSLRDLFPSLVRRMVGRQPSGDLADQEFWALQDVSFEASRGEALGIIGPNGAGKSTSLKLLTKILRPTRGHCHVNGRVGAVIEVAAGFHPDLTGRENVFLQGAIMGMKRTEIARRLDEIVDFSGISAFIDTPVKRYSSGMQARLGFSVAAHLEPDVLFIDEVLSVGDMSFQQKCLERMRENVRAGVTLVFVSHNLQAVAALCKRALVCGRGRLLFDGPTEQALTVYLQAAQTTSTRGGTDRPHFRVLNAALKTRDGRVCHTLRPHTECQLTAEIECFIDAEDYCVGIELERTRDLLYCYGTTSEELGMPLRFSRSGERLTISIDFAAHLTRGHYRINLNIRQPRVGRFLLFAESVADFVIEEHETYDGVVDIEPRIALSTETAKTNYVQPATIA